MRRKFLVAIAWLAVGALLASPGTAAGSHDPSGAPFDEDFAVGSYLNQTSLFRVSFDFSAHSGPRGEAPSGEFLFQLDVLGEPTLQRTDRGSVTCLRVEGHQATFGLSLTEPAGRTAAVVGVSDDPGATPGAEGPDALYLRYLENVLGPGACPPPVDPRSVEVSDLFILTNESGGITVHNAGPSSKEECKKDGWRNFPGFKNQGDCMSFKVARG
jgi:hypothetical protein